MHRSSRKKIKKKVAVAEPCAEKQLDFDEWAEQQKVRTGCETICVAGVADTVRALLQALIRKRVHKFTIHEIRRKVEETHPGVHIGQRGLERHLRICERDLYFRARGRRCV